MTPTIEYRDIQTCPGYRAGSDGSIWSCRGMGYHRKLLIPRWRKLKPTPNVYGHLTVKIQPERRTRTVHSLILEAFYGPPPSGLQCCHNNGDPADNRLENLRYDTQKANAADAIKHGTHRSGERSCKAKLSLAQVVEIRRKAKAGVTCAAMSPEYHVSRSQLQRIVRGERWKRDGVLQVDGVDDIPESEKGDDDD